MFNQIKNIFKKKTVGEMTKDVQMPNILQDKPSKGSLTGIDFDSIEYEKNNSRKWYEQKLLLDVNNPANSVSKFIAPHVFSGNSAQDAALVEDSSISLKEQGTASQNINPALLGWYNSQSFIGWQSCAIIYQNWLAKQCCEMPAEDAVRNGYELTVNDGTEVSAEIIDDIRKMDKKFKINQNMREFITMGRVFGVRIAMFEVESNDPDYYKLPFNIDGVKAASYKGISQIDPYWVLAQLDSDAASNPASRHFYEPTWWKIGTRLIHRTHLIIYRNGWLPDILKPVYYWGGIPTTQLMYEAIYNACRSSTELPALLMTKRTDVMSVDTAKATAQPNKFKAVMDFFVYFRDNFGVKVIDHDDKFERFDTTLTDADQVTMTLYQIVAAAAQVPVAKLLGTTPKGFNSTGEYEEASYHESLKSIQSNHLTPLLERHHQLLMKSYIEPKYGISFDTTVNWKPLDEMTAKEQAEVNTLKAQTGATLIQSGAVSPEDERKRVSAEPDSGYTGIEIGQDDDVIESESQE